MTAHRARIAAVLRANGLTDRPDQYDGDIHSWRCRYPDQYGPCDCFAELLTDLAGVLSARPTTTTPATGRRSSPMAADEWEGA